MTGPRPGWGIPHPDLVAALDGLTPVATRLLHWAGGKVPVMASSYLTVPELPGELITSVRCIVEVEDRIVVCEDDDIHIMPGGHREPGETIRQTAVREVHEETGWHVEPESLRLLGFLRIEAQVEAPPNHPYPYPDIIQLIFGGHALIRAAADWTDTEGYVKRSWLATRSEVRELPIGEEQLAFLGRESSLSNPSGSADSA